MICAAIRALILHPHRRTAVSFPCARSASCGNDYLPPAPLFSSSPLKIYPSIR